MIIVKLQGGLGNQLFQYAFSKSIAEKFNCKVSLDISELQNPPVHDNYTIRELGLNAFNLSYMAATKKELNMFYWASGNKLQRVIWIILRKYTSFLIVSEDNYSELIRSYKNKKIYFNGYWQSEEYFKQIRSELLNCFTLKNKIDDSAEKTLKRINSSTSVSIHFRRGDYLTNKVAFDVLGPCSMEYYKEAVEYISKRIIHPHFFIFSDDVNWVKSNFRMQYPFEIVENNNEEVDLFLMSQCKHNIIANSSFSWWASWLNTFADKIIISPKQWFKNGQTNKYDIVPGIWIKL